MYAPQLCCYIKKLKIFSKYNNNIKSCQRGINAYILRTEITCKRSGEFSALEAGLEVFKVGGQIDVFIGNAQFTAYVLAVFFHRPE